MGASFWTELALPDVVLAYGISYRDMAGPTM